MPGAEGFPNTLNQMPVTSETDEATVDFPLEANPDDIAAQIKKAIQLG